MNNFNWLAHGGPGSGRYELGSGDRPYQHIGWRIGSKRKKYRLPETTEKGLSTDIRETVYADSISYKKSSSKKSKYKSEPKIIDADFVDRDKKKYESPELKKSKADSKKNKKKYESPELKKMQEIEEKEETKKKKDSQQLHSSSNEFRIASKSIGDLSSGFDKAYTHLHTAKNEKKDRSKKVESLSNEELRRVIERIKLNEEYNRVTSKKKSKGYHRTMAALALLGSAATVTATGLSIASGIKRLREE